MKNSYEMVKKQLENCQRITILCGQHFQDRAMSSASKPVLKGP